MKPTLVSTLPVSCIPIHLDRAIPAIVFDHRSKCYRHSKFFSLFHFHRPVISVVQIQCNRKQCKGRNFFSRDGDQRGAAGPGPPWKSKME